MYFYKYTSVLCLRLGLKVFDPNIDPDQQGRLELLTCTVTGVAEAHPLNIDTSINRLSRNQVMCHYLSVRHKRQCHSMKLLQFLICEGGLE